MKKEAMNLKSSKKEYVGGFGKRKGKKKWYDNIVISKIENILKGERQ